MWFSSSSHQVPAMTQGFWMGLAACSTIRRPCLMTSASTMSEVDTSRTTFLKAMGFPPHMFTVIFAIARTAGWIAHWKEMMSEPSMKIGRPRQLYTGEVERQFASVDVREHKQSRGWSWLWGSSSNSN